VGKPFDEATLLRIAHAYDEYYHVFEEMTPPTIKQLQ
jgi:hypothetical protein